MRGVLKTLSAAAVVLLLAAGLAACGGGGDSSSTATEATAQAGSATSDGASSKGEAQKADGGGKSNSDHSGEGGAKSDSSGGEGSSHFVPKHHNDSGGGSEQFRTKGGDNSVQEFGAEADTTELDAAAVALHNFLDARADGDWAATCSYMAKSVVESLEKLAAQAKQAEATSCAGILAKLTNPAAKGELRTEAEKANVGSLRIEGEQAFVIYTGIGGTVLAMPMANEGGSWKVASLAGTPLS